jgi:hypothetical protein
MRSKTRNSRKNKRDDSVVNFVRKDITLKETLPHILRRSILKNVLVKKSLTYCEDIQFAELIGAENMWNLLFSVDIGQRIPYCCTLLSQSIKIGLSTIQIVNLKHSDSESKEWDNIDFEDFDFMFKPSSSRSFVSQYNRSINKNSFKSLH